MRRNSLALGAAEPTVTARDDRATHRKQHGVVACQASFRFQEKQGAHLLATIEDIDNAFVDQQISCRRQRPVELETLFAVKNLAVVPAKANREHLGHENGRQRRHRPSA